MPWVNDFQEFYYSKRLLQTIAANYVRLYDDGLPVLNGVITDLFSLAEFKADFDTALSAIGRGHWTDIISGKLSDYRRFGKLQLTVISDILGVPDGELEGLGFYSVFRLRNLSYGRMVAYLNGKELNNLKTSKEPFIAK